MQFLTSLFGASGNAILTALFALGIVLVLIILGVWLLKLVFNASTNVGRGRNRRLSVVDSLPIDPKRQLLIIRRDNVEHLILTGGAQDLVVESGIPAEPVPARLPMRRPAPAQAENNQHNPQRPNPGQKTFPQQPRRALAPGAAEPAPPPAQRQSPSLRHTGLLRPRGNSETSVIPANTDNSAPADTDSAKKAAPVSSGRTNGEQQRQSPGDDGTYTDGGKTADGA